MVFATHPKGKANQLQALTARYEQNVNHKKEAAIIFGEEEGRFRKQSKVCSDRVGRNRLCYCLSGMRLFIFSAELLKFYFNQFDE